MKLTLSDYAKVDDKKIKCIGEFVNRELSWMDFNRRVLSCADDSRIPLNERLKFLGITGSNLEEFISVRFANAFHNKDKEPYEKILKEIKKFKKEQYHSLNMIKKCIHDKYGYKFVTPKDLSNKEKILLHKEFMKSIFPILTPLDLTANDLNIDHFTTYVAAVIRTGSLEKLIVVPILDDMDVFITINKNVILMEDIILYYLESNICINQNIVSKGVFRAVKDASVLLDHNESEFVVDRMSDTLVERRDSNSLFLDISSDSDGKLEDTIVSMIKVPKGHIYRKDKIVNYSIFSRDKLFADEDESYKPFKPFIYENYERYDSMFDAIRNEDILLHHPYDSFDTMVRFLEEAAEDDNVITIKQSLYRVSGVDSHIVNALCKASYNGIFTVALVEIKARFDEDNNIKLIRKLQRAGVKVVFGDEFLKTHCKMCIVARKEKDKVRTYAHVGTGNYNEKTARLYTDLSYFTSKKKVGDDLNLVFNIISGHSQPEKDLDKVFYSPVNLRSQIEKCIDREISYAKKGKSAEIFIKVNSFSDVKMANKIYQAAKAGVKVYVICRGVCSIKPTKNLYIKSIVGRFLEHSRIYYFKNGKTKEYYIGSADLLGRNLDRRIETLVQIKDHNVTKKLDWIVKTLKEDDMNSFIQNKDGKWERDKHNKNNCHEMMITSSSSKRIHKVKKKKK